MVTDATVKKGYKQTNFGLIPDNWNVDLLVNNIKEMTDFVAAGSFESLRNNVKVYNVPNYAIYVRLYDIRLGLGHAAQKYVDRVSYQFLERSNLVGNEILMANIGANVGETFLMPKINMPATIAPNMIVVRSDDNKLKYDYLLYYSRSRFGRDRLSELIAGSGHPKINKTDLKQWNIIIPPLPEQTAIADALSDADVLIERLERLIAKKKAIKLGAMQQLLTGKKRLPGFSGEWDIPLLGEKFLISAGGDLIKESFSPIRDGVHRYPIYSNSLANGGLYGFSKSYRHDKNCITVTARGTIGVANSRDHEFDAIGRLLVLKPLCELNCFFIAEFLNHKVNFAIESTGVPQLTAPQISKYQIVFPHPKEQTAIATVLSDMDAEIESLERKRDKYNMLKHGMMQQLLSGKIRIYATN